MSSGKAAFERLAGELDYPMFIVTASSGGERAGCLVGFATQCSIDPPRFLVCLSRANRTFAVALAAGLLVVHLLPDHATGLAELFGGRTGDATDKFSQCSWRAGPGGAPVLTACRNWFAGKVLEQVDLGDHVGFLLEPVAGEQGDGVRQLSSRRALGIEAGHPA